MTHRAAAVIRAMQTPEQRAWAHTQTSRALREGRLVRPTTCEQCGAAGKIHGHHADYDQPLLIEWLCPRCHWTRHSGPNAASVRPIWPWGFGSRAPALYVTRREIAQAMGIPTRQLTTMWRAGEIPLDFVTSDKAIRAEAMAFVREWNAARGEQSAA